MWMPHLKHRALESTQPIHTLLILTLARIIGLSELVKKVPD
jgi:hypothetical protein